MIHQLALFFYIIFFGLGTINAQKDIECETKLSLFHDKVRAKKYDAAYVDWLYVFKECPNLSLAIYADGEKILKYKITDAKGEEKLGLVDLLLTVWEKRQQYFASETPKGEFASKACQLQYDYKDELGKNKTDLYDCFNEAFKLDKQTFTHPKSLYTYFSLMIDLYDAGKKSDAELFNAYDDVSEKIEDEIENYSQKLNVFIAKIESGKTLNKKESNKKEAYESYLKNYALIQDNINAKVDDRAVCKNLIPLYTKDFEVNQNDSVWLKRSVSRMYHKDCTEGELYEKLVKQYDKIAPSANTKVYVATILLKKGKDQEAYKYLEEAYKLETRPYQKSKLAYKIGIILKNKRQYTKARTYFLDALKLNPSSGKPHLVIAQMYANSAKDCGKDNFHKRAVFWLAAKEARKASRVDPTLKKIVDQYVETYLSRAPTNEEIFLSGLGGKIIKIGCWINRSIIVPKVN